MRVHRMRLLLLSLHLCLLILYVAPTLASSVSTPLGIQGNRNDLYWEEEIPPPVPSSSDRHEWGDEDKQQRPILLWRPLERQKHTIRRTNVRNKEPHPLRTNVWRIRLTSRNRKYIPDESLIVEFDARGYCKVIQEDENHDTKTTAPSISDNNNLVDPIYHGCVGKWNMIPAGVWWNFSSLQFWAEVHLQPFADHPRMLRGIVVRERSDQSIIPKHWFRPVIATFEAVGIGEDFTDLSYSDRGFSLDSTHTFLK
ncbi:hypothetical protein MHU86_23079 [Fragilaria crotonensis]|nr:hypothetical protein MHU86_23079 [Fragilaria crotonensis]